MSATYETTFKKDDNNKVLNPLTKKYIEVGKRKFNELVRDGTLRDHRKVNIVAPAERGAIPITRGAPVAQIDAPLPTTKYVPSEVSTRQLNTSKKMSILKHDTKEQLPIPEFAKMISDGIKGLDTRGVVLLLEDADRRLVRRTLNITKPISNQDQTLRHMNVREISKALKDFADEDINQDGSDSIAIAGGAIITNTFDVRYVPSQRGGAGTAYKARTLRYYNVVDYKCAKNDCLFAIIMKHGNPEKLAVDGKPIRVSTMRKMVGGIVGAVDVNDVVKIGDVYDVGITIYTDEITTVTEEALHDGRTRYDVEVIRNPLVKGNQIHERQIEILYEDTPEGGHFAYIKNFRKPIYDPITGNVFDHNQSLAAKKKIVIRKGGVWKDIKTETQKVRYKHHILVYDFETVFDEKTGTIKTYSVGWIEFDENEKDHDFSKRSGDTHISYGDYDTCQRQLLEYILQTPENIKLQLVTFNGSRFDSFILASVAADMEVISNITYVKGSILDMNIGRHNTLDLCRLTTGSLDSNCKSYKTLPKKVEGFSHVDIQNRYIDGTLMEWLDNNRDTANEYLVGDVLSTASLYVLMRKSMKEITEITIGKSTKTITASGMAWKYFTDKTSPNLLPVAAPSQAMDDFFRGAINGGRTQAFNGKYRADKVELRMVDVCSLYPSVMVGANRHLFDPQLQYSMWPIGAPIETDRYMEGKIGIYSCTVRKQPKVRILPRRVEGQPLDWNYDGEIETNTSSTSIELIRKFGGIIDVHNGYYWDESTPDLFKESINPLFLEKQKQDELKQNGSPDYNPCRREVTKLLMNSMSGKFAQRNFEDKADFVPAHKNSIVHEKANFRNGRAENWVPVGSNALLMIGKKPEIMVYNSKNAKPSYIAVFIYEFARTYMYTTMLRHAMTIYMDTDSALVSKATYDMVLSTLPNIFPQELEPEETRLKTFGDYEEELYGYPTKEENRNNKALASCITIAPKCYLVYGHNDNGTTKIFKSKIKGVRLAKDILLSEEDKDYMESSDLIGRHMFYNNDESPRLSKPENVIKLFETLYSGGQVHVLCNQWTREIGDHTTTPFVLRQRYIIKTLNRLDEESEEEE
jgi:hypothetical protein